MQQQVVSSPYPATMAQQHVGLGPDHTQGRPFRYQPPPAAVAAACVDEERSLQRRLSNRESARRSRARKERHLVELRDSAALLLRENGDLAARAEAARGRLAFTLLANSALRAEAAVLSARLAAACRSIDVGRRPLYAGSVVSVCSSNDDDVDCSLGSMDIEIEEMIASLMAEPTY